MKKILLLVALLVATSAHAQSTRTQATANLMGLGMPGQLAAEVAGLSTGLGVISNATYLKWRNAANSANIDALRVNASNQVVLAPNDTLILNQSSGSAYFGGSLLGDGNNLLGIDSTDAADSFLVQISGASAATTSRSGFGQFYGNEFASIGGTVRFQSGDTATGNIDLVATNGAGRVRILSDTGTPTWDIRTDLTSNATNGGGLIFAGSGDTVSVQEATAASACMGVATPNGTTPVAVSTTCATTGARVFFTRVGAVTNMGTISTTTAPSGSGFSFASTGASDTLASSVVYLIIKESA